MEFLKLMMQNNYWFGVIIAAICIYCAIWIYKTQLTSPFENKTSPIMLACMLLSFFSWYAAAIVVLIMGVMLVMLFVKLFFKSIYTDFFDKHDNFD